MGYPASAFVLIYAILGVIGLVILIAVVYGVSVVLLNQRDGSS